MERNQKRKGKEISSQVPRTKEESRDIVCLGRKYAIRRLVWKQGRK
jgi:hypothetical protein